MPYTIQVTKVVEDSTIQHVLDNDGCRYWAEEAEVDLFEKNGFNVFSLDFTKGSAYEELNGKTFIVDEDVVKRGVQLAIEQNIRGYDDQLSEVLNNTEYSDHEYHDTLIQLGLFGDVIFG